MARTELCWLFQWRHQTLQSQIVRPLESLARVGIIWWDFGRARLNPSERSRVKLQILRGSRYINFKIKDQAKEAISPATLLEKFIR